MIDKISSDTNFILTLPSYNKTITPLRLITANDNFSYFLYKILNFINLILFYDDRRDNNCH